MVEIIKRGTLPEERIYEAVCSNCTTEIRFKEGEAVWGGNYQCDDPHLLIDCPVCKKKIYKIVRHGTR